MNLTTQRELEHTKISETSGYLKSQIEVMGTSYNSNYTGAGYIKWSKPGNGELEGENVGGRGLSLAIIDHESMELVKGIRRYDVYAYTSERNALAAELDDIHKGAFGNVIYCLSSFDAINTNSTLANAMETARANHWFKFSTVYGPNHRHPYAAIGTSRLGIIKESLHSNDIGADPSLVSLTVPKEWDAIGTEGYGPDLLGGELMVDTHYTSTGYGFAYKRYTVSKHGRNHIKDGEYIRMTGQRKISRDRLAAGGKVSSYLYTTSTTDGWVRSSQSSSYSTEWENFELYLRWDNAYDTPSSANSGGGDVIYLNASQYHMPHNIDTGTSSVRNIQVQRCGFDPESNPIVSMQRNIISGKSISEHIGFKLGKPQSYYDLWASPKNLTNRPNLYDSRYGSGFDTEQVRWFDRTLTTRNEYSIHEGKNYGTGNSNRYTAIGYVNVDPSKMYVGLIWMNCQEKVNGTNYFGTHTLNASNGTTPTYRGYDGYGTTNPYSHYIGASNIEKDKWSLLAYWFLPHWFTSSQVTDFYNKNWSNAFGNYENASANNNQKTAGNRFSNGGNVRVCRLNTVDVKIHLRWLDYYNSSGTHHKTWWALPGIFEVDPMSLTSGGALHSLNIKEI